MSYFPDSVLVELLAPVDGEQIWTNISGDIVTPIKCTLGFSDGDQLSRLAPGSDMRFDLSNINSTYDPSVSFYKGQKIRLRIRYGSLIKTKFFGYIDHIGLDVGTWGQRQAHVTCIDWLALAAKTPVRAIPSLTNATIGQAVTILLTQMQMQPEATDFETGDILMPSVFDQITENSTIYSELQNLVMGEWGYIYMRDGGMTLKIENSLSRTGDGSDYKTTSFFYGAGVAEDFLLEDGTNFLLEDGTNFLLEGEPSSGSFTSDFGQEYTNISINHGDNLVNKIIASSVPVVIGGSSLVLYPFDIATGSKAILIPTASTYLLQGQYKDPTAGGAQISGNSIISPAVSTDWRFNSKADGTGTDLSAGIVITFTAGQSGFKATIKNSGAAGYITKFNVRGIPVYRYTPVETLLQDQRSIYDYGDYTLQFIRQYGQNADDIIPFMFRILMRDRKPRTIFGNPKFNAFDKVEHLAGFLALDIGDQIRLTSTKPASDDKYYIQGVKFTIMPGSEQITFDYVTTETLAGTPAGITEIAIELPSAGTVGVDFGYIPMISNMPIRSYSFRARCDSLESGMNYLFGIGIPIIGSGETEGARFEFHTSQNRIVYTKKAADGIVRVYEINTFPPDSVWRNYVIIFDQENLLTTSKPLMYIDNVTSVPYATWGSGTPINQSGYPFFIGGEVQGAAHIENFAIYDRILSPAEITAIHNGGTRLPFASYPQNGMKFFFGGMDSEVYAAKVDIALGVLDTAYDVRNGFAGQAINGPILREVS